MKSKLIIRCSCGGNIIREKDILKREKVENGKLICKRCKTSYESPGLKYNYEIGIEHGKALFRNSLFLLLSGKMESTDIEHIRNLFF